MDLNIFFLLLRDGLISGSIYALLAVATIVVFTVTRVLFVPQGDFVAFAALSMVAFEEGRVPGVAGLLLLLGVSATVVRLVGERKHLTVTSGLLIVAIETGIPVMLWLLTKWLAPMKLGLWVAAPLTIAIVAMMGATVYRIAFQPLAEASVLVLLIAAFGVHMILIGLGLYFMGPEGYQMRPFVETTFSIGAFTLKLQDLIVLITAGVLMVAMRWFFLYSLLGKALRASAANRVGASLVGIATNRTGVIAFILAATIGAISGILIGPVTTIYSDTGFLIGLKGFMATVLGGLASYPLAMLASLLLGCFESAAAFWASSYKEVLIFSLILPVLLWRTIASGPTHDADE